MFFHQLRLWLWDRRYVLQLLAMESEQNTAVLIWRWRKKYDIIKNKGLQFTMFFHRLWLLEKDTVTAPGYGKWTKCISHYIDTSDLPETNDRAVSFASDSSKGRVSSRSAGRRRGHSAAAGGGVRTASSSRASGRCGRRAAAGRHARMVPEGGGVVFPDGSRWRRGRRRSVFGMAGGVHWGR
jgi:hypothetical protein